MAFTASALQEAQYRLAEMYATPNISQTEMMEGSATTAAAMLRRQRARTVQRAVDGKCVGWEAWFFRPAAEEHSATTAPTTCDIPTGNQGSTVKADYSTAVLARTDAVVQSNRCDNLITLTEELTSQVNHMMVKLRKQLNRGVVIPALTAAAQQNLDTMLPDDWNDDNPRIITPDDVYKFENLNEFDIIAANNNFAEWFWVSGRLFNTDKWRAMLNTSNEGYRDQMLAWAQQQIYFDVRDLDQVMTKKTAFAVEANSYAFWNYCGYTPTQQEIYDRHWVWAQADPFLVWNDDGTLRPVLYAMEMKEACEERATGTEEHRSTIRLYGRLMGGFAFAPEGPNGETGTLEFGYEAI